MKASKKLWLMILALPVTLVLNGCSSTGNPDDVHVHGSMSVYGGYGYPYYGYCCHDDVIIINPPDRPERPERPIRPTPLPGEPDRPSIGKPQEPRPSTGMGRPARGQMSMPARTPRGGGRRR